MNNTRSQNWSRTIVYFVVATVMLLVGLSSSVQAGDHDSSDGYYKNSSLLQYQDYINTTSSPQIDDCFSTGKVIWDTSELNNTEMPDIISSKSVLRPSGGQGKYVTTVIITGVAAGLLGAIAGGPLVLLAAGAEYLVMMDTCTNNYVVAPHEYFNQHNGLTCNSNSPVEYIKQEGKVPLTPTDIPFFYHCDPNYDPLTNRKLTPGNSADAKVIGRTYGYMGAGSQYCTGDLKHYGDEAQKNDLVGKIVVESAAGGWYTVLGRSLKHYNTDCSQESKRERNAYKAGDETFLNPAFLFAYYKMFSDTGKIKMCVASLRTIIPLRIACGTVAPPGDEDAVDPFLKAYLSGTRCEYLIKSRDDLHDLGKDLDVTDQSGVSRKSVKGFLKSNFHFTSTVVGCLKDMLFKIFIKKPSSYGVLNEKPFFQKVQERLKQIVMAVLVLYVSLVGLKIMMSPEPPKRAEVIMMIMKFALVIYFATGDAFYKVDGNGNVVGLFPSLLDSTDEIANIFLASQNDSDPLGFCTYKYNGKNLLGEVLYQGGGGANTVGMNGVKLTVWDLVDCKLINYLNMGSCDYTPGGLAGAWFFSMAFFVSGIGLLLGIASFVYCLLILLVIFKFAHICILALITVTILIFLSPIFIPFVLFETTKGMYDAWLKSILGYLIYPALLFAFLAIMIATLDKIYYGDLKLPHTNGAPVNLVEACKGVESIYCYTMGNIVTNSTDACDLSPGFMANKYVVNRSFSFFGTISSLKESFANGILPLMLKLMLFAILFFMFMNSVTQFFAALLGINDLGSKAHGALNAGNALNAVGLGAITIAGKAAGIMKKDKE